MNTNIILTAEQIAEACEQHMKYSVLLLYPDHMAETYGHETFYSWVEAKNSLEAIQLAQKEALETNNCEDGNLEDFYPLLVTEGHIYGQPTEPGGIVR